MHRMTDIESAARKSAEFILNRLPVRPRFGIILGTGSGVLAERISNRLELSYSDIPGFPQSTALGHKGSLVCGKIANQPVVAMNGRFHLYEGHSIELATFPIRTMKFLGVTTLFITNASGGLNPQFKSGDVMAIQSHIDLMFRTSVQSSMDVCHSRPKKRSDQYDEELIFEAACCARQNDFPLHIGTYAALMGPNYETRAEYRMLRLLGADVAGMSTIPEIYVANQLAMQSLALSIITNVAKPDVLEKTSGQEVIDAAQMAAPRIYQVVEHCINMSPTATS